MKEGSVITVRFEQNDGEYKFRPAILIKKVPPYNDCLVCSVSTQLKSYVSGLDIIIDEFHTDFKDSG